MAATEEELKELVLLARSTGDTDLEERALEQLIMFRESPEKTSLAADLSSALKKIPGAMPLTEFAAGVNRSILGAIDFLGPDNINAIFALAGSDVRMPTATQMLGAPRGSYDQSLLGDVLASAGEMAGMATMAGGAIRSATSALPAAMPGESAAVGTARLLQQTSPGAEFVGGALAGTGAEVGKDVAGPTGEMVGGALAPFAISPLQAILGRARVGQIPQAAKEVIEAGEEQGVRVLTSDVIPPEGFVSKSVQQLGEKLGPLGTGGQRAAQQKSRQDVVDSIAREFGVSVDSPLERTIVQNLEKGIAARLNEAATIRRAAIDKLDPLGDVPVNKTLAEIDKQISRQVRLRADADQSIIDRLTNLKESIQGAEFGLAVDLRSNLGDDIRAAFKGEALPTKAIAPLQAVKSAIDDDLLSFARSKDKSAAIDWVKSNRLFAENLRNARETELKRLLTKGTETPEVVAAILKGGRVSELNRLQRLVGEEGRTAGKAAIIRDALAESGYFSGNINPDRFATAMNKPARQRAVKAFFKGKDRKEIEGIVRLLDATRRAQQANVVTATGQQAVPLVAGIGAAARPIAAFLSAGTLSASTKAYESRMARNLLLKLSNTVPGSKQESALLKDIIPAIVAVSNTPREVEN